MSSRSLTKKKDPAFLFGSWESLNLHHNILDAINDLGFKKPTEIQKRVIPSATGSRHYNIIGAAETV